MLEHDSGEFAGETLGADYSGRESGVDWMFGEVLCFMLDGHLDLHFVYNVLLTSVPDSDEPQLQWDFLVHQHPPGIGPFVHNVYFGDDSDGPLPLRV